MKPRAGTPPRFGVTRVAQTPLQAMNEFFPFRCRYFPLAAAVTVASFTCSRRILVTGILFVMGELVASNSNLKDARVWTSILTISSGSAILLSRARSEIVRAVGGKH